MSESITRFWNRTGKPLASIIASVAILYGGYRVLEARVQALETWKLKVEPEMASDHDLLIEIRTDVRAIKEAINRKQ